MKSRYNVSNDGDKGNRRRKREEGKEKETEGLDRKDLKAKRGGKVQLKTNLRVG